jgi:hypothetical protein
VVAYFAVTENVFRLCHSSFGCFLLLEDDKCEVTTGLGLLVESEKGDENE